MKEDFDVDGELGFEPAVSATGAEVEPPLPVAVTTLIGPHIVRSIP